MQRQREPPRRRRCSCARRYKYKSLPHPHPHSAMIHKQRTGLKAAEAETGRRRGRGRRTQHKQYTLRSFNPFDSSFQSISTVHASPFLQRIFCISSALPRKYTLVHGTLTFTCLSVSVSEFLCIAPSNCPMRRLPLRSCAQR